MNWKVVVAPGQEQSLGQVHKVAAQNFPSPKSLLNGSECTCGQLWLILCKRQEEVRVGRVNDFNVCLLSPQRPKSRSLHHYSEESWLLAAVWWWHCGGAWLLVLAYLFLDSSVCLHCHLISSYLCCAENWCPGHWGVLRSYLRYLEELWVGIHPLLPIQGVTLEKDRKDFICFVF